MWVACGWVYYWDGYGCQGGYKSELLDVGDVTSIMGWVETVLVDLVCLGS